MRKRLISNLVIFILVFSIFCSCEKDPPTADFSVTQRDINENILITFTDLSSNNPDHWNWTFKGGSPETSTEQNPIVVFKEPGVFDVTLEASNDGGSDWISKTGYINIVRLISQMVTDAEVSIGSQTNTLPANSYIQFAMFNKRSDFCHIETSGKDANGKQTGLLIFWDSMVNLTEYYYYTFGLSNELVFFNVSNKSNIDFTHFMVNCWNPDFESLEEVFIPNDGIKYGIGYYLANTGMEVRAYSPGGYTSWIDNDSFDIPGTDNQFVNLSFNGTVKTQNNLKIETKYNNPELDIKPILKTGKSKKVITESGYK